MIYLTVGIVAIFILVLVVFLLYAYLCTKFPEHPPFEERTLATFPPHAPGQTESSQSHIRSFFSCQNSNSELL